jgi:periplasmic divalent cation tolerance protein
MSTTVFCYVTCPSGDAAATIARRLVEERLAACGNVLPRMRSVYRWQGAIHEAEEAVLILKTRAELVDRVSRRVKELHRYECPCVAALPVTGGNPDYLAWIVAETAPGEER